MSELIAPNSLKDLVDAHAIRRATVVAAQGSFKITVKYGMVERTVSVRTRGGQIKERVFTSLDAVARFMHDKGASGAIRHRCVAFRSGSQGAQTPGYDEAAHCGPCRVIG